jgi:hypothetical protein
MVRARRRFAAGDERPLRGKLNLVFELMAGAGVVDGAPGEDCQARRPARLLLGREDAKRSVGLLQGCEPFRGPERRFAHTVCCQGERRPSRRFGRGLSRSAVRPAIGGCESFEMLLKRGHGLAGA